MLRLNKRLLILTGCCVLCVFGYTLFSSVNNAIPAFGGAEGAPVVIIDPGHGGIDGGAVSADGYPEKDINLEISLRLRDIMRLNGWQVVMTRDTDMSIHDESAKSVRQQKVSDLYNRLDIMKNNPQALVVSVHLNTYPQTKYYGAMVFYGVRQAERSKELAELLQANLKKHLQPENGRVVKKGYKDLFLLQQAPNITVLVECGFMSNIPEMKKLRDEEYQTKLAVVIAVSLMEYYNKEEVLQ